MRATKHDARLRLRASEKRAKRRVRDRGKARRVVETSSERETRRAKRRVRDITPPRACKRVTFALSRPHATSVSWIVPGAFADAFAPATQLFCDTCSAWPFFSEDALLTHCELTRCAPTRTRSTNVPPAKSTSTTPKPLESALTLHCDTCQCLRTFNSQDTLRIHQKVECQRVASHEDASPSGLVDTAKTRFHEVARTSD